MKKPRISRSLWALAGLLASAAFGVVMTFAVAFACGLWSSPGPNYFVHRIAKGTSDGADSSPDAASAQDWKAGQWVFLQASYKESGLVPDLNPNVRQRFERLEAASDKDWNVRFQRMGAIARSEGLLTNYGFGLRREELSMSLMAFDADSSDCLLISTGWPVYCFEGSKFHLQPGWVSSPPDEVIDLVDAPAWLPSWFFWPTGQQLPIGIRPIALVLDILFWAAIPFAMFFASRLLRRLHRKHRRLCLSCGYDRQGLPAASPCPECGHLARA